MTHVIATISKKHSDELPKKQMLI